jgi:autotransporter-associated beta strand protein
VSFINDPNTWTVDLVGTLRPAQVNMLANQDYLWQGGGRIVGAQLNLTGTGTLIFANSATNHFALGTLVSSGTLQIGDGGATGVLPTGPLTNNATLAFHRGDDITIPNVLDGTGYVRKNGANILTLSAANAHTGGTLVSAGTLKVAHNAALGSIGAITTVSNGATLDILGQMLWDYTNAIVINGPGVAPAVGALTKSEPTQIGANQIRNLTLGSDASIGGVANALARWWHLPRHSRRRAESGRCCRQYRRLGRPAQ